MALTGFGRDMVDERCIIIIIRRGAIISGVDALFTMWLRSFTSMFPDHLSFSVIQTGARQALMDDANAGLEHVYK
jgi:hypothetical protein